MSVLLYGSEAWKLTKKNETTLQVFVNKGLRQILGIYWPERISNERLHRETKQKPVNLTIRQRKWKWIGHILRREPDNITRQSLDWNPQWKRKRGRPVTTWKRTVEGEVRRIGMTWGQVKRTAQDRDAWRVVVDALCPSRGEED